MAADLRSTAQHGRQKPRTSPSDTPMPYSWNVMPGSDLINRVCWGVRVGSNTWISHLRAGRRAAPVSDEARRGRALRPPRLARLAWSGGCVRCRAAGRAAAAARGCRAAAPPRPSMPPGAPRGGHQVELEVGLAVGTEGVHHAGLPLQQRAHAADPLPPIAQPALPPRSRSSLLCRHAEALTAAQYVARRSTGAGQRASGVCRASGSTATQAGAVPRTLN